NQQGKFQLLYVAPGNYRLFAIRDRDGNRKYNRGIDALGVTTKDISLTPDNKSIENINFQISVEDTISPSLKAVYAINQANLVVRFNEEIENFDETNPDAYFKIIAEKEPNGQLKILKSFKSSSDLSSLFMMTENQAAIDYKFIAENIKDKVGNVIDTISNTIVFPGNTNPDTTQPTIVSKSIKDSTSGIPLDHEIRFSFSEAMSQNSFEKHFGVKENDTLAVSGIFSWKNPADVVFQPDRSLKSLTWYTIQVAIDSIKDRSGNSVADSIKSINFRTLNEDTLSAISGTLVDENEQGRGKLFLTAKSEKNSYYTILNEPGQYRFENILPGIYTINGFCDADSNAVYSYGRAAPFQPAERFFYFSDSIKVRSRWPNEGNDIVFK
ncbi:MAG TPA: Ig-like domain-containing protein, partial [bacterium]